MDTSDDAHGETPNPEDPTARLRIGDAERVQAIDELTRHFTDGRLDRTEFDDRTAAVHTARTRADLAPLFFDLPGRSFADAATRSADDGAARSARTPARFAGDEPTPADSTATGDDDGPSRLAKTIVAVTPLLCVIAFFVLANAGVDLAWLVFLLIPVVGIVVLGPEGYRRRRDDRHRDRRERRELRRGGS